ncbi:MAG: ribosome hibernation-promoting factor, HPF/YfiA family [Paracoccaceae bacterium]
MRYQISGKQLEIGEALQAHVKAELGGTIGKYAQRATDANVVFTRDGHQFHCEATIHLSTGLSASARGDSPDAYVAFETCRERMDKQLRRYKRRIRDHHHHRSSPVEFDGAPMYVLAAEDPGEDSEPEGFQPVIVAEMETRIPALSVGEAVMQMELSGAQLLVFRNEKHGRVNVVHRREDGNVGWIDPQANG